MAITQKLEIVSSNATKSAAARPTRLRPTAAPRSATLMVAGCCTPPKPALRPRRRSRSGSLRLHIPFSIRAFRGELSFIPGWFSRSSEPVQA